VDVDQMLSEISSRDFARWMAYSRLEPWGEERADLRMGIVASVIANSNRGKNQKPFHASDFIPSFEPVNEEEQAERLIAKARAALGG
jgi:hypothetical protein